MPPICIEPLPRFLDPMLATSGGVPQGSGWAAEVKWDGLRGQLRHDGRRATLRSRNGHDLSSAFPELVAEAGRRLGRQAALLDAEIVCVNADGRPDFGAVRGRMHSSQARDGAQQRSRLVIFDVLHVGGLSTRGLPYRARRSLLDELDLDGGRWIVPAHFVDEAAELAAVTRAHGLEGVVFSVSSLHISAGAAARRGSSTSTAASSESSCSDVARATTVVPRLSCSAARTRTATSATPAKPRSG